MTLGQTAVWQDISESIAEQARNWLVDVTEEKGSREIADSIRQYRKALVPMVFDPRDMETRVASFHEARHQLCPHG